MALHDSSRQAACQGDSYAIGAKWPVLTSVTSVTSVSMKGKGVATVVRPLRTLTLSPGRQVMCLLDIRGDLFPTEPCIWCRAPGGGAST